MNRVLYIIGCLLLAAVIIGCETTTEDKLPEKKGITEKDIQENYTEERGEKYESYLVSLEAYSLVQGIRLQKKYHDLLIGLIAELAEKRNYTLAPGSVGFYFDRRSDRRNELYLGLDIRTNRNYAEPHEDVTVRLLKRELPRLLDILYSCVSIFQENSVVGVVLSWSWSQDGRKQTMTIWITKNDIIRYRGGSLTYGELVQRSTVTNTDDNIIRPPL